MLTSEEYKDYVGRFNKVYQILKRYSLDLDIVGREICRLREYYPERMLDIIKKAGFLYITEENESVYSKIEKAGDDLALFNKDTGDFRLKGRFIFPVYDMLGNVIALIGWYPDKKKYITTPSRLFSKTCLFYGMEQLGKTGLGKSFFLVEGIFDCLSVRSVGFNCIAQMGIDSSRYKQVEYSLFKDLIAIPDNDSEGRGVISYDGWKLPSGVKGKYFRWTGDKSKDIDKLCNSYEEEDIKELLESLKYERKRVISKQIS